MYIVDDKRMSRRIEHKQAQSIQRASSIVGHEERN